MIRSALGAGFAILFSMGAAQAQEEAGSAEFMAACAGCHGEAADGNGPVAAMMNLETPALNTLSSQNDGEFPFMKVFMVLDGRGGVRAHGSEMPVWGDRYMKEALISEYPETAEMVARGRMLSLVYYLESVQQ